jgi:hypothetical protein
MFPFTFFRPLSNFVPFDHKYVVPPMPIKLSFLPRAMMSFFFLLTKKLKPKDVHGRSSNYTLGRVLGSTLHNIVLWGHLTKWNDLEELTPNIHELRVCAH